MQTQSLLYRPNHSNITTKKSFSQEVRPQLAYLLCCFTIRKYKALKNEQQKINNNGKCFKI